MSNGRRLSRRNRRELLRAGRCPDCTADVTLHQGRLNVAHDPSCPALAALERQGRTNQLVMLPGAGSTPAELADVLVALAQRAREHIPDVVGLRVARSPYAHLYQEER